MLRISVKSLASGGVFLALLVSVLVNNAKAEEFFSIKNGQHERSTEYRELLQGGAGGLEKHRARHHRAGRLNHVLARTACRSLRHRRHCRLNSVETDTITEGFDRIQYHFQVGPGEFDTITVHRIIPHDRPRHRKAMMLLPGIGLDVEGAYMPKFISNAVPDDFSPLIHMAAQGIDAWSADYRGSDLPAAITDFSFMADWGLATATSDMQIAIRFARLIRLFSDDGNSRMHIGGWSAGVPVVFSLASADAARKRWSRDVAGVVAIDDDYEVDPENNDGECAELDSLSGLKAEGVFHLDDSFIIDIALLAKNNPNGPSDFLAGFTNLQFFYLVFTQPFAEGETFHLFGGNFDEMGFPFPVFAPGEFLVDGGLSGAPNIPLQFFLELAEVGCSAEPVSNLDGGLANVTVPVLHLGAAGGNANNADYTLSLLGSDDITSTIIGVLNPGMEAFDYGHGDIVLATEAPTLVWQLIADWVLAH